MARRGYLQNVLLTGLCTLLITNAVRATNECAPGVPKHKDAFNTTAFQPPANRSAGPTLFASKADTGEFVYYATAPVAAHIVTQIPNTNTFLLADFLKSDPHPGNHDVSQILVVFDRAAKSFTSIANEQKHNLGCSSWAKLTDGNIGIFGGHSASLDLASGVHDIHVYHKNTKTLKYRGTMDQARWYSSAMTLPDGKIYIPGGSSLVSPKPKAVGAQIYDPVKNTKITVPMNKQLYSAGYRNYFMGAWLLHTGDIVAMNCNMIQVLDPISGKAKKSGPKLPAPKGYGWEYPKSGSQVQLVADGPDVNGDIVREYIAFGGTTQFNNQHALCSTQSYRIKLIISKNGKYYWGSYWVPETMPGPRCLCDATLLPNGNVLITNGFQEGYSGLPYPNSNSGNEPDTQPWLYIPTNPIGKRYQKTGVRSNIARGYHSTALLTSEGDVMIAGCSNCKAFTSDNQSLGLPKKSFYSITKYGTSEYRIEFYRPKYLYHQRPEIVHIGNAARFNYKTTVPLAYQGLQKGKKITSVVLMEPGIATHGYAMDSKAIRLAFTAAKMGALTFKSPETPKIMPPGYYLLFIVSGDQYSEGKWVQLYPPAQVLSTFSPVNVTTVTTSQFPTGAQATDPETDPQFSGGPGSR